MLKWISTTIALLGCLTVFAQQPGTIVIRKKKPAVDTLTTAITDLDTSITYDPFELDSFYTRDNPHIFAASGMFNREGYTVFNNIGLRYGYYVMPYIAMGIDYEYKYYRHIYKGSTIGPFIRFEYYLRTRRLSTVGLFTELDYQIALLKPNPEAISSLGYREVDLGMGLSILRWFDRGISVDLKGSFVWNTTEASYERYSGFLPSVRFNVHL